MDLKTELLELIPHITVIDDVAELSCVNSATFSTGTKSTIIARPASAKDIQTLIRYCAARSLSISVVSGGRNWGFGSRVPVENVSILLDLSGMNRVISYNEEFGTVRVEPGVTFKQLSDFLRLNGNKHFVSMIGGDASASVLGNILERGDGSGPYCDRSEYACSPEIVLANGEIVETGYSNIRGSKVSDLAKAGIGPGLQEIFFQSNFGIVTKLTLWLRNIPNAFRYYNFKIRDSKKLGPLLDDLRSLYQKGILSAPVTFWNDYKQMVNVNQYPWHIKPTPPLDRETVKAISNDHSAWTAFGGIYVDSEVIAAAIEKEVVTKLTSHVEVLGSSSDHHPFDNSPLLGQPTRASISSLFWRKRTQLPPLINPDTQKCGLLWNSFLVPFNGQFIAKIFEEIEDIIFRNKYEPVFSFIAFNDRHIKVFQQLIFDRDIYNEDERAIQCHKQVFQYIENSGCSHNRLDILNMSQISIDIKSDTIQRKLKEALDPQNMIMPGRYTF